MLSPVYRPKLPKLCLILSAALLALASTRLTASPTASSSQDRPDVLMIAIDDLNDWIGPLGGHPMVQTPHMDRLAARGVTFTNAHCQSPICNPSRTSLMMGLRPSTTGIYAIQPWFRTVPDYADWVTLPQYFMQHGYNVVATGKVYHDAYPPKESRIDGAEFSVWGLHGKFNWPRERIATPFTRVPLVDWGAWPERDEDVFDYDVVTWAVDYLEEAPEDKPLFLNVGIRHPHLPLFAPQKWFDLYPESADVLPPVLEGDRDDVPPFAWYLHWKLAEPRLEWVKAHDEWMIKVRAYLASVSFADAMVGRVLDALEASGRADNTIIVLYSDHGYHLGEKAITGKNTLWERSARVPLIISGPGFAAGEICQRPVELLDLYPTLVDAAGLEPRGGLEGLSLVPLLENPEAPRTVPAITTQGEGNHSIRSERYRYIRYGDGSEELYDMAQDPNEWDNLADEPEYAAVLAQHRQWLPKTNAEPVPGSKTRLLEKRDDGWYWQLEKIEGPVLMGDPSLIRR